MLNTNRPSFGPSYPPNSSLLLEKTKANFRQSTPDSEALASSDDDQEQLHRSVTTSALPSAKPIRRPSWLSDNFATTHRRPSSGSVETLASGTIHQMTSSIDTAGAWAAASPGSSHSHTGSAPLPWNNAIWGSDNRKMRARLAEVLPSPTSTSTPPGALEPILKPSLSRRDSNPDAAIPFPIPLQPTLKTYRSQSYSVGQMEQEANAAMSNSQAGSYYKRGRTGTSIGTLHHRSGRPNLYEFAGDNLCQVQEVEDDEDSVETSDGGVRLANSRARTIEQLAMENAILRQQALANQAGSFSHVFGGATNPIPRTNMRAFQLSDSVLEEPDDQGLREEDLRSSNHSPLSGLGQNVYSGSADYMRNASPEAFANALTSQSPASFKRAQWQSQAALTGLGETSQSRRHSFADIPRRTLSGNPNDSSNANPESARARAGFAEPSTPQAEISSYMTATTLSRPDSGRTSSAHGLPLALNPVPRPQMSHYGQTPSHLPQYLYLVTFKAARAEFYYVQEGTGLEVNEGDLVIVEADRGTDLGTVAHKNIDWSQARKYKDEYTQEHYQWLMMFSRHGQNPTAAGVRPSSSGNNAKGNVPPGLAAQGAQAEPSLTEIKPKLIKRLAQQHEIHTLREKEGNEAKAKRMCQQKVAEHHLNMEILDAEFQMDWKKLTFYYFADSYINFNSLVTDLFKIYKTRIWMSAVNPASFVTRNPALPLMSGTSTAFTMRDAPVFDPRSKTDGVSAGPSDNYMGAVGLTEPSHDAGSWFSPSSAYAPLSVNPYAPFWNHQGMQPVGQQPLGTGRPVLSPPSTMAGYGTGTAHVDTSHYGDPLQQNLQGLSLGN